MKKKIEKLPPSEKLTPDSKVKSAQAGRSVTLVGAVVNALLILCKFVAGIFGQSQALIADAVHSVSDLFTDAVVLFGLRVGRKEPDEKHHFGHARIETLQWLRGTESQRQWKFVWLQNSRISTR